MSRVEKLLAQLSDLRAAALEELQQERAQVVSRLAALDRAIRECGGSPARAQRDHGRVGREFAQAGTRTRAALEWVREHPGATVSEIVAASGVTQPWVCRMKKRGALRALNEGGRPLRLVVDEQSEAAQ